MVKGILFLVHFLKINNVNFDLWEIGVWSSSYSSIYWELVLIKRWVIEVHGAPGTLYANESYQLQVDFPEHYPMEAPQVAKNIIKICISFFIFFFFACFKFPFVFMLSDLVGVIGQVIFLQPAPLHPHIYSNGHICLGNFYGSLVTLFSSDYICLGSSAPFVIWFL